MSVDLLHFSHSVLFCSSDWTVSNKLSLTSLVPSSAWLSLKLSTVSLLSHYVAQLWALCLVPPPVLSEVRGCHWPDSMLGWLCDQASWSGFPYFVFNIFSSTFPFIFPSGAVSIWCRCTNCAPCVSEALSIFLSLFFQFYTYWSIFKFAEGISLLLLSNDN